MTFTPWARMTVNCTRVEPGGRGHVETTHKLLCFFIRIRMFVQINLRHIKHKMTRLVWLTKCPHVPQASPSATNTVNWRNSLDILFSLRSLSSWGRPRFITTSSKGPCRYEKLPLRPLASLKTYNFEGFGLDWDSKD